MSINVNTVKYGKSGIYLITNIVSGKKYVGSAVDIKKRWREHISGLKNKEHGNSRLQRSWDKHGTSNFKFEVLSLCPPEYLIKLEQFFIDILNPFYNICKVAGSRLGAKLSDDAKKKISAAHKGIKKSFEHKQKLSIYGKENATHARLKKHWEDSKVPIYQYTLSGEFVKKYLSVKEASSSLGIDAGAITKASQGKGFNKTCADFQFKYFYKGTVSPIKGHCKRIILYKDDVTIGIYRSIAECAKSVNIQPSNLAVVIAGKSGRKKVGGYTAKEITDAEYQKHKAV